MKKNALSLNHATTRRVEYRSTLTLAFLLLVSISLLSSCDDGDEDFSDAARISGTYSVAEKDVYDEIENYTITIAKSKNGGADIEISNFGDFMYKPVIGSITGNQLTIPPQSFTANSTIVIAGHGTLTGNTLSFDYTLESGDDIFEYSCEATKQK